MIEMTLLAVTPPRHLTVRPGRRRSAHEAAPTSGNRPAAPNPILTGPLTLLRSPAT
jgi:hypothetical protein